MNRRLLPCLLALAVAAAGCGDDAGDQIVAGEGTTETTGPDEPTSSSGPGEPDDGPARPFELRPVLELVQSIDDDGVPDGCRTPAGEWALDREVHAPQTRGDEVVACYLLGPTDLTEEIVATATTTVLSSARGGMGAGPLPPTHDRSAPMDNVVSDATPPQTEASTPGVGATFRALAAGTSIERRHRSFLHQGGGGRAGLPSASSSDAARLAV